MNDLMRQHTRDFDIIGFTIRMGRPFRQSHTHEIVSNVDNAPAIIARLASQEVAKGFHVLVLESGCIKRDWSRVNAAAFHALVTIDNFDFVLLKMNVSALIGANHIPLEEFCSHVRRSFPEYAK